MIAVLPPLSTFALANGRERYDMVDQARTDGTLYAAPIADAVAFAVTVVFMLAFYRSTKRLPAVI